MILFLQIFISTNLPAHTDNPLRFNTRNKYAVLREKRGEKSAKRRNRGWSKILTEAMGTEQSLQKTKEQNTEVESLQDRWHRPRRGTEGHLWQQWFPETANCEGWMRWWKETRKGNGLNLGKSEHWRSLNIENHQQPFVNKEQRGQKKFIRI